MTYVVNTTRCRFAYPTQITGIDGRLESGHLMLPLTEASDADRTMEERLRSSRTRDNPARR